MRFRRDLSCTALFTALCLVPGCGGDADESHGVGGNSGSSNRGGTAGVIGTGGSGATSARGGSGGTIPVTGGTAGTSAGTTGTGGNDECATTTAMATPELPVLIFLVDLSLSMNEDAPGGGGTKWVVTRDALETAFSSMRDGTNVGLVFYPDRPTGQMPCFDEDIDVPIAPLNAAQRMALDNALQGENPSGSTPTHDAYVYALEQLEDSPLAGQKYVVLITDGIPTYALGCEGTGMANQMPPIPTQPLIDESATAMSNGIRSFVIGSPGSEDARASLSQMASEGGTAAPGCSDTGPNYCHLDMTTAPDFSAALNAALAEVISGIPLTCDFTLPAPPPGEVLDPNKVNVVYTDGSGNMTQIGRDASLDLLECNDGWQYAANYTQITLCGELCEAVKNDPMASVTIQLGCQTIVNPP